MFIAFRAWPFARRLSRSQRLQIAREIQQRVADLRRPKLIDLPIETRLLAAHISASHWRQ